MAFRFSLESILRHRRRQEEAAHRDFVEAQGRLDQCLKVIEAMYLQIDETRVKISEAERKPQVKSLEWVCAMETFIEGQKLRIDKERMKARELIRDVELKEEELLKRLNERKAMDKLKELRFEEYKANAARQEMKEQDDLTNARQARGKR